MKITDIKADGTTYWFERANDWGHYLRADYTRGAVKRVDEKRYVRTGYTWSSNYREDPKGRYILVERVAVPGDNYQGGDQEYVLAAQVRDEFAPVKEHYDAHQATKRTAAIERQRAIDALNDRADALRFRLADFGADKLVHVRVREGDAYHSESPRLEIEFGSDAEAKLGDLLTLLENLAGKH